MSKMSIKLGVEYERFILSTGQLFFCSEYPENAFFMTWYKKSQRWEAYEVETGLKFGVGKSRRECKNNGLKKLLANCYLPSELGELVKGNIETYGSAI